MRLIYSQHIPILPMSLNERGHWAKIKKEKDQITLCIRQASAAECQQKDGSGRFVRITFFKSRGPLSDDDNRDSRRKPCLDGLQRRGWLYSDAPAYCKSEAIEQRGQRGMLIEVFEVEQEAEAA